MPARNRYFLPQCQALASALVVAMLAPAIPVTGLDSTAYASDTTYKHVTSDGSILFSDAPVVNGELSRSSYPNRYGRPMATNSCIGLNDKQLDSLGSSMQPAISKAALAANVPIHWIMAITRIESCFDPKARSRAGAEGLMQLMPATARQLGVVNSLDGPSNLAGGARYFAAMMKRFDNRQLALAAYNAGPGNVEKYGGVPPFPETQRYVELVTHHAQRYQRMLAVNDWQ